MIKVWGRPTSTNTQRVLWALVETGQPFELTLASATMGAAGHVSKGGGAFGIVDTPAYRAMNPHGTVPTIDDGGLVLWDSNAIVQYLAAKYAADLLCCRDPATLARASQWMFWVNERLEPPLHTLVMELVRLPPARRDPVAAVAAFEAILKPLAILDRQFAREPYLAGAQFTLGDIPAGCAVHRWMLFAEGQSARVRPSLPHLEAWHARLADRAGFKTHVAPRECHMAG